MATRRDQPLVSGYTNAYVRSVLSGQRACPFVLAQRLVALGHSWNDLLNGSPTMLVDSKKVNKSNSRAAIVPTRDGGGAIASVPSSTKARQVKKSTNDE